MNASAPRAKLDLYEEDFSLRILSDLSVLAVDFNVADSHRRAVDDAESSQRKSFPTGFSRAGKKLSRKKQDL